MPNDFQHRTVSPAILEQQVKTLRLLLAEEQRDHKETARQRDVLQRRIEGFERMNKTLSKRIDQLTGAAK